MHSYTAGGTGTGCGRPGRECQPHRLAGGYSRRVHCRLPPPHAVTAGPCRGRPPGSHAARGGMPQPRARVAHRRTVCPARRRLLQRVWCACIMPATSLHAQYSTTITGASLVANMSSQAPAEVAIAACHLLDKAPRLYTTVLRHGPTLRALIAAVCDQCCGVETPTSPASSVVPPGTPGGGSLSMPIATHVFRRESAVEAAMSHDAHSTPAAALLSLLGFLEKRKGLRRASVPHHDECVR